MIKLTVKCKAFSHEGVKSHAVQVLGETVYVWDPIADHYTTCHALSQATQRRIVKMAATIKPCV